jgi:hypothetical protein
MRRRTVLTALTLLALTIARTADAQGSVAGRWIYEFNRRVTISNGERSESDPVKVRLTLTQHGVSVAGTWQQISPADDPMPKPRGLRGTIAGGTIRLTSDPAEALIQDMGGERKVSMVTTLEFTVSGDELSGTRKVSAAGEMMDGEGRPFRAAREKQ